MCLLHECVSLIKFFLPLWCHLYKLFKVSQLPSEQFIHILRSSIVHREPGSKYTDISLPKFLNIQYISGSNILTYLLQIALIKLFEVFNYLILLCIEIGLQSRKNISLLASLRLVVHCLQVIQDELHGIHFQIELIKVYRILILVLHYVNEIS